MIGFVIDSAEFESIQTLCVPMYSNFIRLKKSEISDCFTSVFFIPDFISRQKL